MCIYIRIHMCICVYIYIVHQPFWLKPFCLKMEKALFMQVIKVMNKVRTNEEKEFSRRYGGPRGARSYWGHSQVILL